MNHAITMGIFWHLIGAASAACFYAPFKKVKHWSWETMWSVGGIVSWLILPWAISAIRRDLAEQASELPVISMLQSQQRFALPTYR